MAAPARRLAVVAAFSTLVVAVIYVTFIGPSCRASTPQGTVLLDGEQAQVAATIAAVAARRQLPERAVVIAYATGLQESKLRNLRYGDRDSVGVFQQRPSQGWGTPRQLQDPVYASEEFFAALVRVPNYLGHRLDRVAQEVQRSADGSAYAQHEGDARVLAAAFTGRIPGAVTCWHKPDGTRARTRLANVDEELARALGGLVTHQLRLSTPSVRTGWLIAGWAVAHAREYGIQTVRYDGFVWTADKGRAGWAKGSVASRDHVELM